MAQESVFGTGSRKQSAAQASQPGMQQTPTSQVWQARQQGIPDENIISDLSQQGFGPEQINDAMSMAEARSAVEAAPGQFGYGQQPFGAARPSFQQQPRADEMPPPPQYIPDLGTPDERIEELAEAIIDEKWKELSKNIDKIIDWKERTEAKINQLEQAFVDLKKDFESLHSAILGKVAEYDNNIVNIGSEIKALEKVFQKLLPTFTDNVNELSRVTKQLSGNAK